MVLVVKNPPPNTGDTRDASLIPGRRKWPPTPVLMPGESHGQRSLAGYRVTYHWNDLHTDRSGFLFYWGFWCLTLLQLVLREHVCSLEMKITVSLSLCSLLCPRQVLRKPRCSLFEAPASIQAAGYFLFFSGDLKYALQLLTISVIYEYSERSSE